MHGVTHHIGAWTHRCAHSRPNTANISSPWPDDRKAITLVDRVKEKYDGELRSCWTVGEGNYLVGTDADGIQLRILAHYMESETYIDAILKGTKEDETDIHSLNKKALGSGCRSRDDAKTFIYAWLLGAGVAKVASILGVTPAKASSAMSSFLSSLPELKRLKEVVIPLDAARGFFRGLDGRKVVNKSEYLMLAGYLQNGEQAIMKTALVLWYREAKRLNIPFNLCSFVHDEWQTEVTSKKDADALAKIQQEALVQAGLKLNVLCPITGGSDIGKTWKDTH